LITSRSNPLIKQVITLRQRKARSESGLFVVEGIHHVGEAVEGGWEIESLLYAPDMLASEYAISLISRVQTNLQKVSSELMEYISDKENPQGILGVVHQRKSKIYDVGLLRLGVALISPQDPGNVGTILRTLDAVKADALFIVDGGVDPYHPTSVRASMGTIFWIPIIQTSFDELVTWAQNGKVQLIGSSAHGVRDPGKFKPNYPCILLMGSEQKGLSPEHIKFCEHVLSLPMRGRASSLNLAVAAGIFLYQLMEK
jgi:TrmH family RNA methyltransferase